MSNESTDEHHAIVASVMAKKNMRRERPLGIQTIPQGESRIGKFYRLRRPLLNNAEGVATTAAAPSSHSLNTPATRREEVQRRKAANLAIKNNFDGNFSSVRTGRLHERLKQSCHLSRPPKPLSAATPAVSAATASSFTIPIRPATPRRAHAAREKPATTGQSRLSAILSQLDLKSNRAFTKAGKSTFSAESSTLPVTPTRRLPAPSSPSIRAPMPRPLTPSRTRIRNDLFGSAEPTSPMEELQPRAQCKSDLLRSTVPAPASPPSALPARADVPTSERVGPSLLRPVNTVPAPASPPSAPASPPSALAARIDTPTSERTGPSLPHTSHTITASSSTCSAPAPTEFPRPASSADEPSFDAAVDLPPTPQKQAYASSHVDRRRRQARVHPRLPVPRTSRYSPRPPNALTTQERERVELVVHRRMRRHQKAPAAPAPSVEFCAEAMRRVVGRRIPLRPVLAESWTSLDKILRQVPVAPVATCFQMELMMQDDPMTMYEEQAAVDAPAATIADVLYPREHARWGLPPAHSLPPVPLAPAQAGNTIADIASDWKVDSEHLEVQAEWEQAPMLCLLVSPSIPASHLIPILGASVSDYDEPMDVPYQLTAPEPSSDDMLKADEEAKVEAIAELCPAVPGTDLNRPCNFFNEDILVQQSGEARLLAEEYCRPDPDPDVNGPCDIIDEDVLFRQLVDGGFLEEESCREEPGTGANGPGDVSDGNTVFQTLGEEWLSEEVPCPKAPGAACDVDADQLQLLVQALLFLEETSVPDCSQTEGKVEDGRNETSTGLSEVISEQDPTATWDGKEKEQPGPVVPGAISLDMEDFLAAALEDEKTEEPEPQPTSFVLAQEPFFASQETPAEPRAPVDGDFLSFVAWFSEPITASDFLPPHSLTREPIQPALASIDNICAPPPDINDPVDGAEAILSLNNLPPSPALPTASPEVNFGCRPVFAAEVNEAASAACDESVDPTDPPSSSPDVSSGFRPVVPAEANAAASAACDESVDPTDPSSSSPDVNSGFRPVVAAEANAAASAACDVDPNDPSLSPSTSDAKAEPAVSPSCTSHNAPKAVDGCDSSPKNLSRDVPDELVRSSIRSTKARRLGAFTQIPASSDKDIARRRLADVGRPFVRQRYARRPYRMPDNFPIRPVPLTYGFKTQGMERRLDKDEGPSTRSMFSAPSTGEASDGDGDGDDVNLEDDLESSAPPPCDTQPPQAEAVVTSLAAKQDVVVLIGRMSGLALRKMFEVLSGVWSWFKV